MLSCSSRISCCCRPIPEDKPKLPSRSSGKLETCCSQTRCCIRPELRLPVCALACLPCKACDHTACVLQVLQKAVCPEKRIGIDSAVSAIASVTEVKVSGDLTIAKVYLSIFSDEEGKTIAISGLKKLQGYVRKHIATSMNLRMAPEVRFLQDDTIERAEQVWLQVKACMLFVTAFMYTACRLPCHCCFCLIWCMSWLMQHSKCTVVNFAVTAAGVCTP